ncbi:MAG: hypothetical protein ABIS06_01620 [Vicinamibacterales bacterium]
MRRLIVIATLALAPTVTALAQTLSTRDVIELSKAGLGEEVLLALVEVNKSVFPVDRGTLKSLKDAGVPANVIVAMVRSGRDQVEPALPVPPAAPAMPQDVIDGDGMTARERELERADERAKDRELERDLERIRAARRESQYVAPVAVPVPVYIPVPVQRRPQQVKPVEPVYWGWDGKRRPDSWDPEPTRQRQDPKPSKGPGGN